MSKLNKRSVFGWGELVLGILLIALGIFTFVKPESMLTGAVFIYGIIIILVGLKDIFGYVQFSRIIGFGPIVALMSGLLSVMCGVALIIYPNIGKVALTVFLPIWFMAHCISGLTHSNFIRLTCSRFYFYFTLIMNIIGLVFSIIMLFSPTLSFLTLRIIGYLIAAYLILFGIEEVISAFAYKPYP